MLKEITDDGSKKASCPFPMQIYLLTNVKSKICQSLVKNGE